MTNSSIAIRVVAIMLLWGAGAAGVASAQSNKMVSLRYRFTPGQTIAYNVIAYDSIVIYDSVWRRLAVERAETVTFRCDSVRPDGAYVMTLVTTSYSATERRDSLKPVERHTHPWVGRTITFLMTPSGRRLGLLGGASTPGTSPGGPLAPLLLPNLGADSAAMESADQFDDDNWLVDNVFPPIRWRGSAYRSVKRAVDTLGQKTVHVEIAEVGNSAYRQAGSDAPMSRGTVNGAGRYFLAPKLGYPVGGGYEMINRFTMDLPGGRTVEGRHVTGMSFELVRERRKPANPRGGRRGR